MDYSDSTPDVSFTYDVLDRIVTVNDGSGTRTMTYSPTTLALQTETRSGLVPATITHKYANTGVVGRNVGYSLGEGHDVTYGYDSGGHLSSVSWNVNGQTDTVTYSRGSSDLLTGVTYGSGLSTTYEYEATRDLKTRVKNGFGATTISQYDYQHDALGRRTSVRNSGLAFAQPAFNRWQYNDRNELIESGRYLGTDVTQTNSPVADEYRAYNFDPIGNRLTSTEGTEAAKSYQANLLNEYTSVGGAALTYDADGNLTSDGTRRFTYDAENRLVLVEPVTAGDGSVRVRMAYDYLGRRVQKVVEEFDGSAWAAQDDVRFVYLGWNVIEERRTSGDVNTKKNFVWGLDLSQSMDGAGGIGGLLAVVDEQGGQMAFLYDANGNVGQLVDEQGAVQASYEYDAFGNVLLAEGSAAEENAWRFSTKMADAETGLMYYGYRYYDPQLGRWTQRDPLEERGGLGLFVFVLNSPTGVIDADGRYPTTPEQFVEYVNDTVNHAVEQALTEIRRELIARLTWLADRTKVTGQLQDRWKRGFKFPSFSAEANGGFRGASAVGSCTTVLTGGMFLGGRVKLPRLAIGAAPVTGITARSEIEFTLERRSRATTLKGVAGLSVYVGLRWEVPKIETPWYEGGAFLEGAVFGAGKWDLQSDERSTDYGGYARVVTESGVPGHVTRLELRKSISFKTGSEMVDPVMDTD